LVRPLHFSRPARFAETQKQKNNPSTQTQPHMAHVKIKPIGDRVLVEHIEEKEQVRGGIIIPDSAKEKPQEAKVIALGTGKREEDGKLRPFEVKVGDRVLIAQYGGSEVKLDDKKYKLVREDDILGIIA
jgi:chaperonin GroES